MWFELTLLTNYLKLYLNLVKNVGLDGFRCNAYWAFKAISV